MTSDTGDRPVAGVDYPRSTPEFLSWFRSDVDCLDYLEWLRWPDGFPLAAPVDGPTPSDY
ncbi:MAG: hypothetical protein L0Y54_22735 [Sporichthyaceae bacterium]|nr:hypothetical protein [Sporichthyaceae bacterium]